MALSNFKKLATTTLDGKEYMFAIYEDGVEYAPGDTVMVSGVTKEITIERIIPVEPGKRITAEVIAKIEKALWRLINVARKTEEKCNHLIQRLAI